MDKNEMKTGDKVLTAFVIILFYIACVSSSIWWNTYKRSNALDMTTVIAVRPSLYALGYFLFSRKDKYGRVFSILSLIIYSAFDIFYLFIYIEQIPVKFLIKHIVMIVLFYSAMTIAEKTFEHADAGVPIIIITLYFGISYFFDHARTEENLYVVLLQIIMFLGLFLLLRTSYRAEEKIMNRKKRFLIFPISLVIMIGIGALFGWVFTYVHTYEIPPALILIFLIGMLIGYLLAFFKSHAGLILSTLCASTLLFELSFVWIAPFVLDADNMDSFIKRFLIGLSAFIWQLIVLIIFSIGKKEDV